VWLGRREAPKDGRGELPRPPISKTRSEASGNIQVPEKDSVVPEGVAKPTFTAPASAKTDADIRKFLIEAKGGEFIPSTVIVRQGDSVRIEVTAVDREYDFIQPDYGLRAVMRRGETKTIAFGATAPGKFIFYCERCGGPAKGPIGEIVVAPR